ncbi:hypothetical protein RQP46_003353 [Phenoliferia psychrophenolica]
MVNTSDEPSEPNIPGQHPANPLPFTRPIPAARRSPLSASRQLFSWPVYALAAFLFVLANVTSAAALPSPASPFHAALAVRATTTAAADATGTCACQPSETSKKHTALFAVEATMIPVLVILSGIFAGLTLGYMSLDSTQLNVLSKTGTAKQQYYAKRVIPIRKDGHLLLITLLLANMIVNETLPVIADGVLGGGVQAVVISTVLVVIFSEIIPQSVCSRFGLAIGSAMVTPVRVMIYCFYIVSWPVARLLEYLLGAHSGVVYRRAELKELINMHSDATGHGGDLQQDTITIVGATLDLQTKVVSDAMTPLSQIFMLPITSVLDYETLGRVLKAGHSRIPVYEEVVVNGKTKNKVIGVLLTKQLILLDPEDATPLANIPMNPLPTVSEDLPLLQILNTFQEGRSHMAIVCRRKAGFHPLGARASQPIPVDGFAKELLTDKEKTEAADSDMEKGEATGEQSMLRSLFRRKNSASPTKELEMDDVKSDRASKRSSLSQVTDDDSPVGVITLEDVLEELIGEEIYDETDRNGTEEPALQAYIPPEAVGRLGGAGPPPAPSATAFKAPAKSGSFGGSLTAGAGISNAVGQLKGMVRSRSAPGKSRSSDGVTSGVAGSDVAPSKDASTSTPSITTTGGAATVQVAEPESLALIRERSGSDSSDTTDVASSSAATATDAPLGILAPANLIRPSSDPPHTRPAPPLLSDAVLLERGRRMLVAQGVDPTALPNLRLAAPRSQPPSRSGTPPGPGRLIVPAPSQPVGATKKGSFKSPPLAAPIPTRHQSSSAVQTLAAASSLAAAVARGEETGSKEPETKSDKVD